MVPVWIANFGSIWGLCLLLLSGLEQASQAKVVEAAQQVAPGMTREEVREILGSPHIDYRPQWDHWLYGTSLDPRAVFHKTGRFNPIPIRLRLFSYAEDDVVIRWDLNNRVLKIDRPESIQVSEQMLGIHETVQFLKALDSLVRSNLNG